jgi:hypothetical protein
MLDIQNFADAQERLRKLFFTGTENDPDVNKYAQMAALLSKTNDFPNFEKALEVVSKDIWEYYKVAVELGCPNRLTRSILGHAQKFGFSVAEHVVFMGKVEGKKFLQTIRDGVLWKDSFSRGHGEFSHSYQWLAAGQALNWGMDTARLYKGAARWSKVPLSFMGDDGPEKKKVPLWLWLVDSTNWQANIGERIDKFDDQAACFTVDSYRNASNVSSFLRQQSEWFIGFYEIYRVDKVLFDRQQEGVIKNFKDQNQGEEPSNSQLKKLRGKPQREGLQRMLKERYDNKPLSMSYQKQYQLDGEGAYKKQFEWLGGKGDSYEEKSFHGIQGDVPKKIVLANDLLK